MVRFLRPLPRTVARLKADRCGATVIEFALLIPIFLLLLMGTARMGHAIGVQHALGQLAASAARYALPAATPDRREALARTYVAEHGGSFTLLDDRFLDLSIEQSAAALAARVAIASVSWSKLMLDAMRGVSSRSFRNPEMRSGV